MNWIKQNISLLLVGFILFVLSASFISGCRYGRQTKKCPTIKQDTVYVHDTAWHTIKDTTIITDIDTLELPADTVFKDVDTNAILKDYFTKYGEQWEMGDSNLLVKGYTQIQKNRIVGNTLLSYKWLQPTTVVNNVVNNSVHYNRYLYFGLDIPLMNINCISIEAIYAWNKGYIGVGYTPYIKSVDAKFGIPLLKLKQK